MEYTTHTPLDVDHVIAVLGKERFLKLFFQPREEWDLTPHEIARLAAGPHRQIAVYLVDSEYFGLNYTEVAIECECGETFADRLLSQAQRKHDEHSGYVASSHVHTADMLAG